MTARERRGDGLFDRNDEDVVERMSHECVPKKEWKWIGYAYEARQCIPVLDAVAGPVLESRMY
jgi:hypothetical protein